VLCVWVGIDYLQPGRRIGIPQTTEKQVAVIPASIEQIQEQYEIIERERVAPDWDYIWNTVIEEGREKKSKRQPFSQIPENFLPSDPDSNEIMIAESAVKVSAKVCS
jgi:transcription factor C subunit 3